MGHFGLSLGYVFWDFFAHARYEYTLAERFKTDAPITETINQDRSDFNFQMGYFIIDGLEAHVAFDFRAGHGGIDFVDFLFLTEAERQFHDLLIREGFFMLGGGASYSITETMSVSALFRIFLAGTNTRNGHVIGLGFGYSIF